MNNTNVFDSFMNCEMGLRAKPASLAVWGTPIARTVSRYQIADLNIYIAGFDRDERYALVVNGEDNTVTIADVNCANGLGVFECSKEYWTNHGEIIAQRFPRR